MNNGKTKKSKTKKSKTKKSSTKSTKVKTKRVSKSKKSKNSESFEDIGVIVVDDDIDVTNSSRVEWALMTRWQPDKDTLILSDQKGSSLDPSRSSDGTTSKIGMDATIEPGIDRSPYESVL